MSVNAKYCPHCGRDADKLEDERLDVGYQELKRLYPGGFVEHADDSIFYLDLRDLRIVFEFGENKLWRVNEAWVEVPHMTLHFEGYKTWQPNPEEAIKAIFNTKNISSYEKAPEKNP